MVKAIIHNVDMLDEFIADVELIDLNSNEAINLSGVTQNFSIEPNINSLNERGYKLNLEIAVDVVELK